MACTHAKHPVEVTPHLASIVCAGTLGAGGHDSSDDPIVASLYDHLTRNGVACTIRRGMLRFAFHLYNNTDDVDRVLELVRAWNRRG